MKVRGDQGPQFHQGTGKISKGSTGGKDFKGIMDEKLSLAEHPAAEGRAPLPEAVINGVQLVQEPQGPCSNPEAALRNQVVNEIQQSLDLVDLYAERLGDTSFPAGGMDSLVGHLEDRMDALSAMEASPETPGKLRSVLSDVVLTMGTEIAKFRRGDYS